MYSVGLILYEMYQPFCTEMERVYCLNDIRKGKLSEEFSARWSQQVSQNVDICAAQ